MKKHTPGPWVNTGLDHQYPKEINIQSGNLYIARTIGGLGLIEETANANLIAAAPELLEALRNLMSACYKADLHEELSEIVDGCLLDAAETAIAKANGEEV